MRQSLIIAAAASLLSGIPAWACSPPPGDIVSFFAAQEREYLEQVTSVYRGVLTDVSGQQDDPIVSFSIRKTGDLWGPPEQPPERLSFENGQCTNYRVLMTEYPDGEGFADGLPVRVFVTPASRVDPELLYIVPEGPVADDMMSRLQAIRSNASSH